MLGGRHGSRLKLACNITRNRADGIGVKYSSVTAQQAVRALRRNRPATGTTVRLTRQERSELEGTMSQIGEIQYLTPVIRLSVHYTDLAQVSARTSEATRHNAA